MAFTIPQDILELVNQLLVFDRYTRALGRGGEFGTELGPDLKPRNEVFFECLIHSLFPDFFTSSPFDVTFPAILRNGEVPLEVHIESGSNASFIKYPGILKETLGSEESRLDVPDRRVIWRGFFEVAYAYISDLNLRPADTLGKVDLHWHFGTQSLMLSIEFETAGEEIEGYTTDFVEVFARVFLKPRISRGRMLWDWGVMSFVKDREPEVVLATGTPLAVIGTAYDAATPGFKADILRSFPEPPLSTHSDAANGLASGLVNAFRSLFAGNAELIGNALMSLPLRPQNVLKETLTAFLAPFFPVGELGVREKFLLGIITGYFTRKPEEEVDPIEPYSALGKQNLLRIFPFGGRSASDFLDPSNPLLDAIESMTRALRAAWRTKIHRELSSDEEKHLKELMVPRELESFVLNHLEVSHLVDRIVTYNSFAISAGEPIGVVEYNEPDRPPDRPVVALVDPVPCMRYQVSLELLELVSDRIEELERELFSAMDPHSFFSPDLGVEWEVYSFHEAFGDPIDETSWRTGDGSFAGAQLLGRERKFVPFRGTRNGTDGLLSKALYLEWSTTAFHSKLLIVGRIFCTFASLSSEEFMLVIPMTPEVGLFSSDSVPVRGGEVDNVTTFKKDADGGRFWNLTYGWRIFGRLVQKPFARNTEWISLRIKDLSIFKPRFPMRRVQLEARLNGVPFQTSQVIPVGSSFIGRSLNIPLGSGWSQEIVFDRPKVARSFELEIILHILADESFSSARQITFRKTFLRFSDADGREVFSEDSPLESAVEGAVRRGRDLPRFTPPVFEWGIPIGLSVSDVKLQDEIANPQIAVTVEITKKNLVRTPPELATKTLQIDFPKAKLIRATPGSGADEVKFFPLVEHSETRPGAHLEPTRFSLGSTRRFEMYAGTDAIFPGPPRAAVECHPGASTLRIACSGTEYDPPFSTSDLGTAERMLFVATDSSIDGPYQDESDGPDGSFEMTATVTTTSGPPKPRLTFERKPEGIDFQASTSGTVVMLEYAVGWADRLYLLRKEVPPREDGTSEFTPMPDLVLVSTGTIAVRPTRTTFYKIRSIAGAFSEDSRELQVFIA